MLNLYNLVLIDVSILIDFVLSKISTLPTLDILIGTSEQIACIPTERLHWSRLINQRLFHHLMCLKLCARRVANSVDPDQMLHSLSLHCLLNL